ncbi:MAG: lipoate--protein ligase [Candidatus Kariarchaeaceae archaeon]
MIYSDQVNNGYEWFLVNLGGIAGIDTQVIWHAAALVAQEYGLGNFLIITWPNDKIVCVGHHQDMRREVDLEYCKQKNIPVVRRACGGGQVLLDKDQLFYQVIRRETEEMNPMKELGIFFETFLEPVVKTYRDLGIEAEYKPVNDIMANNKKISGNGAASINDTTALVGNFILEFPHKEMAKIFNVPNEKFRDQVAKTLEERVGSIKDILGKKPEKEEIVKRYCANFEEMLGVRLIALPKLPKKIMEKAKELKKLYTTDEWKYEISKKNEMVRKIKISGEVKVKEKNYKAEGGLIQAITVETEEKIEKIGISGDFFIADPSKIKDLEKTFTGIKKEEKAIREAGSKYLEKSAIPGITPEDFVKLLMS